MRDINLLSNNYENENLSNNELKYIFNCYRNKLRELVSLNQSSNMRFEKLLEEYNLELEKNSKILHDYNMLNIEYINLKNKKLTIKQRIFGKI